MSATQAVMSTQAPTTARSPERSNAARPVRALTAAAIAPQSASTRAATVAPYPRAALTVVALRWRSPRCAVASSGLSPSSGALSAQALQQLLVPRLGAVVGRLVLLGVLGQDQRGLEIALLRPRALDHGAASLGEEIGRRALVFDGNARFAVGEREGQIQALRLPLERARLHEAAETVGLARHGRGQELARRDEVDDGLAHARPDEIGDGRDDDEPAGDELAAPAHSSFRPPRAAGFFALPLGDTVTARKAAVTIGAIVPDRQGQVKCRSLARQHPNT